MEPMSLQVLCHQVMVPTKRKVFCVFYKDKCITHYSLWIIMLMCRMKVLPLFQSELVVDSIFFVSSEPLM